MAEHPRPEVGVSVVIHDRQGNIVMGERARSHGADLCAFDTEANVGTMQCPGGHLEYGESFADCAKREVLEETGLEVGEVKFLVATNDIMEESKHYVTIFVTCVITGENKVPQPLEPHKCARWDWIPWSQMWERSKQQAETEAKGEEVKKRLFLPLVNLYREYPELEHCLKDR